MLSRAEDREQEALKQSKRSKTGRFQAEQKAENMIILGTRRKQKNQRGGQEENLNVEDVQNRRIEIEQEV